MPDYPHKKVNTKLQSAIENILTDRPIAYHPILAKAVGSVNAGIFLSQLLYWTPRAHDQSGWIYKTQDEIYEETALGRREQETARRILRDKLVLQEKKAGVPSRLFFRVDMNYLAHLLGDDEPGDDEEDYEEPQAPDDPNLIGAPHDGAFRHRTMSKPANQGSTKAPDKNGANEQTIYVSETTTKITTENDVVVEQLTNFGIHKDKAQELAKQYPEEYLSEKLSFAEWLVGKGSNLIKDNPAGFLIRAIQNDFTLPPNFETPGQTKDRTERATKLKETADKKREQAELEYRQAKEAAAQRLKDNHPPEPIGDTGLTTESAWVLTLEKLQSQFSSGVYQTWIKDTMLVQISNGTAHVVVPNQFTVEYLNRRFYQSIARTLSKVIDQDMTVEFLANDEVLAGAVGE